MNKSGGLLKELDQTDAATIGQELHRFAADLYPICRSITGNGIRRTLAMIQDRIPLLTFEVLTAFFLEAGFLGVALFGWNKVGPGLHFFATLMVALGTLVSATWILASNSWMQTPQGYEIIGGRIVPVAWLKVIFNPSFPYRLAHMTVAAYLATALIVGASGAWHLLKGRDDPRVRTMLSMAMWMLLFVAPVQIFIGDAHGLNTLQHQPAKIAAIEGHWQNEPGQSVPLILFGWPDMAAETTRFALEVPALGSLILTHDWKGHIPGLKEFAPGDRPNSTVIFWTFRVMVGLGLLMLLLGLAGACLRRRDRLYRAKAFLRCAVLLGPAGLIAILAGWITTEMGRQPWVVYGVMRTRDAVSNHSALAVGTTLIVFIGMYFAVFGTGVMYMLKLIGRGPQHHDPDDSGDALDGTPLNQRPSRPLSAAPDAVDPTGPTAREP